MARNRDGVLGDIDAAVAAAVSERRITWFDRLPAEAQETFLAAREKFHAGGYEKLKRLTLARILVDHAATRGWDTCDYKRMHEWLAKQS